jgi:predicted DNA-binding transcriptional regulator AlpA
MEKTNKSHEENFLTFPSVGFYRAQQCAALLGVSKSTFWLWAQQKIVQGIPVPQPVIKCCYSLADPHSIG